MPKFEPVRERSRVVVVEGHSTIHPIRSVSHEMEGWFEAEFLDGGELDPSFSTAGRIEVFIDDFSTGNSFLDHELRRQLDTRRFPSVLAELVDIRPQEGPDNYWATGDLTFHGETQRLENDLRVKYVNDQTIEVNGEITIDVRNFNVDLPNLMFLKVHPVIKVTLEIVAERVA
ncbi:MAG: YceI family protein [Anaerolineae bacterium]|nr:YceI family protein [Anaerolineae bacterium]